MTGRNCTVNIASYRCVSGGGSSRAELVPRLYIGVKPSTYQSWGYPVYVHYALMKMQGEITVTLTPVAMRGPDVWKISERTERHSYRVQISLKDRADDFPEMAMRNTTAILTDEKVLEIPWPKLRQQQLNSPPALLPIPINEDGEILRWVKAIARDLGVTP